MEDFLRQLHTNARGIWKYRWPAIAVMWLSAAAGWTTVACVPDDYQTSARVWVDTQGILKPLLSGMTSIPNVEQQVAIMSRTLLSKPNIERVMRMVNMDLSQVTPREHEVRLEELMNRIRIGGTGSYDIYTITYNSAALAAALALGCATALLANRARPTFGSAAELRAVTGLQVVGTIAMYWTPVQLARRRRGKAGLGAAVASQLQRAYGPPPLRHRLRGIPPPPWPGSCCGTRWLFVRQRLCDWFGGSDEWHAWPYGTGASVFAVAAKRIIKGNSPAFADPG